MGDESTFDQILEAIEQLPSEQQTVLVQIVRKRLAERARQQVVLDANEAREEHRRGEIRPMSVENLIRDLQT